MTVPDFSPAMLRLFIEGRVVRRMGETGEVRASAKACVARDLGRLCGLAASRVLVAHAGYMNDGGHRTRLWAALGLFPADHGLMLTDDGGQVAHDR